MSVVVYPFAPGTSPDEAEERKAILRDLTKIIYETLPHDQAEAYITRLRHLLNDMKHTPLSH